MIPTVALALAAAVVVLFASGILAGGSVRGLLATIRRLPVLLAAERGAVTTFIPEFWIRELLRKLRTSLVYGQPRVANRNYEGVIRGAGDTVNINSVGEVTVFDYVRNTDMPAPEELTTTQRQLLITESKAFNFQVDDVDAAQAAGNVLGGGMESAAFQLRDVADKFIAGHYTDVQAANLHGTDASPITVNTPALAYDNLVELAVLLDEADVPSEGRWAVIPPWYHGLILKDDRFVGTGGTQAEGTLRNGQVGEAAGFTLMKSNNVPFFAGDGTSTFDNYKVISGVPMAHSYAEQINKTEAYRIERRFADAVKGLHVYGAKLVYPEAWAVLSAAK